MTHPAGADAFLGRARAIVGPSRVLTGAAIEPRYLEPARYGRGAALAVVKPASEAEVAALVTVASVHDVRLVPQGAHTGLVLGATPSDPSRDVVLCTERLREVFDFDPLDLALRVSAGFRLSEINARLEGEGVMLAIDLSSDPSVGGLVAANAGGTRMLRYGDVRANTLGLTVALAEPAGALTRFGPALAKNNAGIDFKQLHVGTGGAFGIVTEAVFRLHRIPRQRAVALVALASSDAQWIFYRRAGERFGELVSAFEGLSGRALELAVAHGPGLRMPFDDGVPPHAVLLELSSALGPETLDLETLLSDFLATQYEDGTVRDAVVGRGESLWAIRHRVSEGLRAHGEVMGLDLSFPRSAYLSFVEAARGLVAAWHPGIEIADFGHLGDGGVHFNLVWPRGALDAVAKTALRAQLYDLVDAHGGCFSAEHGVGPHVQSAYDRHTPPDRLRLAGRLVAALAPRGTLGTVRYAA